MRGRDVLDLSLMLRFATLEMSARYDEGMSAATNGDQHAPPARPRSPWVGLDPFVDPVGLARVLRRAHSRAVSGETPSSVLRAIVAKSWARASETGVDPDGAAPTMLDSRQTARALASHPVSHLLPQIRSMLSEATEDARYIAVLSDATGLLLWVDGHTKALEAAIEPGFLPGHLCSERAIGTNAVGTAIELNHPVQIFSAEHFNRRLHGLTCSAAPIRDPDGGCMLGVLNLSGHFRTGHPHSLSLISAVACVIEGALASERLREHEQLRGRFFDLIVGHGRERSAIVTRSGRVLAASPRGWLGSAVKVEDAGALVLPEAVAVDEELTRELGGALFVRTSPRRSSGPMPTITVRITGRGRVRASIGTWSSELTPRHSTILMLLVTYPEGLSSEQLRSMAFKPGCRAVTVRAEMSRLRKLLGPILASNPYRIEAKIQADRLGVERYLDQRAR